MSRTVTVGQEVVREIRPIRSVRRGADRSADYGCGNWRSTATTACPCCPPTATRYQAGSPPPTCCGPSPGRSAPRRPRPRRPRPRRPRPRRPRPRRPRPRRPRPRRPRPPPSGGPRRPGRARAAAADPAARISVHTEITIPAGLPAAGRPVRRRQLAGGRHPGDHPARPPATPVPARPHPGHGQPRQPAHRRARRATRARSRRRTPRPASRRRNQPPFVKHEPRSVGRIFRTDRGAR